MLAACKKELYSLANPSTALLLQRFFKTGPGQYGEGDIFLGIKVPPQRQIAKKYASFLNLFDIENLLHGAYHEERMTALFMLVEKYQKGNSEFRRQIYEMYLKNARFINNWDLVDLSAPQIVGHHLLDKPKDILFTLIQSDLLWEKRIAVLATFPEIKKGKFATILALAPIALPEKHDLMHKSVGWMLREMWKRDIKPLRAFLDEYALVMPRTMLRYAIEKMDEEERRKYMGRK